VFVTNLSPVTIWLDCGRDLAHSPSGPWLSKAGYQAQMIPVFRHSPEAPFREIQARDRGGTVIPQAASNLYRDNCSSVVTDLSTFNPFSALFELLLFSAAAESQFLNMISSNLRQNREMLFNDSNDENVVASSRSNLMHSLDSLEEHMKDYREIVAFVQRRRERPSSENSDPAWASTVNQILTDFKCLLNRSELLCRECERNMSIAMSNASIAEAKRGLEQSQSLFKFTMLASVYVPLSFTASFFGMNFREIGQGKLSIWLYFAVSLPIFALSALTLFLDKKAVQVWFSELT
jgi:Mg2+ and Co2+ transporter CorA